MTDEVELLSHGPDPARAPRELSRPARSVLTALALAGLVFGAVVWGSTSGPAPARATRALIVAEPTFAAPPRLAPRLHQIHVSTTSQSAQVTSRGYVDLDLQLVNDGSFALSLLDVRVPQPGVSAATGPGVGTAAASIAELVPATATPIVVHLFIRCPQGLGGPAADHLELTLRDDRGATRNTNVDLRSLPGFWDHVRHSACSAGAGSAVAVQAMPTSIRWADGTN